MSLSTAPSSEARPSEAKRGGRSFLASDLSVRGSLRSSGTIEIDGIVDGDISGSVVRAASNSRIRATVDADSAFIAGTVTGLIKARSVTFADDCLFTGEVQYERLRMEPNARVEGALHPVVGSDARTFVDAVVLTEPLPRLAIREEPAKTNGRGRKLLSLLVLAAALAAAMAAGIVYVAPVAQKWRSDLMESLKAEPPAESVQTAPAEKSAPAPAGLTPEPVAEEQAPRAQEKAPSAAASVDTAPVDAALEAAPKPSPQPETAAPAETVAPVGAEELSEPSINNIEDAPAPAKPDPVSAEKPIVETPAAAPAEPAASVKPPPPVTAKPDKNSGAKATKDAAASPSGSDTGTAPAGEKAEPVPAPANKTTKSAEPAKIGSESPATSAPANTDSVKPPIKPAPNETKASKGAPTDAAPAPAASTPSTVSGDGCQWVSQCTSDGSDTKCVSVRECSSRN